jgi:sialate O-acetylesterase
MRLLVTFFFFVAGLHLCHGQIVLPRLISDNAVFQRDRPLKLFGSASAKESIKVILDSSTYTTVANDKGEWSITVPPHTAGGPHRITFSGKNVVTVKNILFGDVWICSGQSNMELTMDRVADKYEREIATSKNNSIRYFEVPDRYNFKNPDADLSGGAWLETDPETVRRFSAVAYFFARDIQEKHNIPVGLINAALGGSPAEAWMSEHALTQFPHYLAEAKKFRDDALISKIEYDDRNRISAWYDSLARKERIEVNSLTSDFNESEWRIMNIPAYIQTSGEENANGAFWFLKKFNVDRKHLNKRSILYMGRIVDQDSVFINGKFAGTTSYQYPPRRYPIPAGLLKEGENTIVVRLINQSGRGGFVEDKPYLIKSGNDTINLAGEWRYKRGAEMPPLAAQTFIRWKPLGLYNAMIAPLQKFPVTGVIWYQGEANTSRALEYERLFQALINDWRKGWNYQLPFLFVQLPNFMKPREEPGESDWAQLRESQRLTTSLPKTAMAVAIDVGEWKDIHPFTKDVIGKRLALLARKIVYGETSLVASGPEPTSWRFDKSKVEIRFKHAAGGLVSGNGKIFEVTLSADGKKFVRANAIVKGEQMTVWHEQIENPVAVRYAWADNPVKANLYNSEGLPATPFQLVKNTPKTRSRR